MSLFNLDAKKQVDEELAGGLTSTSSCIFNFSNWTRIEGDMANFVKSLSTADHQMEDGLISTCHNNRTTFRKFGDRQRDFKIEDSVPLSVYETHDHCATARSRR